VGCLSCVQEDDELAVDSRTGGWREARPWRRMSTRTAGRGGAQKSSKDEYQGLDPALRPGIRCALLRPWSAEERKRVGVGSQDDGHDRIRRKEDSFTGGRQAVLCTLWVL
jgi:hypothetical protein